MKKCKDCEYFDKKPINGWGDCNNDEIFQEDSPPLHATNKALLKFFDIDGCSTGASFKVNENFGCVAYKKRKEE